nr:hypothetical protein [uncultured Blautia sp.]
MQNNEGSRVISTLKNTGMGLVVKLITLITNFGIRTLFIYYLGIEYTGVSSVFKDVLTVLSFAELGIGSAITYALYKPIHDRDYRQIARLMGLYKKAYRIIAVTVLSIGICLVPFLEKLVTNVPSVKESLVLIYLLYIIDTTVSYLLIYKSTLLTANQKSYIISIVTVGVTIFRTIAQAIVIVVLRNFVAYLIITISFTFIQNLIISKIADMHYPEIAKYKDETLSADERKGIFADIKALSLYKISGTVLNGTDSLIISSMLGAGIVGYTSNYTMIITELYNLMLQFLNAVTASVGNMVASKDKKRQVDMFVIMNFVCEVFFSICTVCLYCLLNEFVGEIWLGQDYVISKVVVLFLCLDFYLKGNATIVNSFRNANGLFVQGQYRPVIMAVINIIVSIVAVKLIGLPGVFLGTVVSRVSTQVWYDPLILYKYGFEKSVKNYYINYIKWFMVVVVSAGTSIYINSMFKINFSILSFIVHGLNCIVWTLVFILAFFGKSDQIKSVITYINTITKRIWKR